MLPIIKVSIVKKNASKRQKLVTAFVIMSAMAFLWIEETTGSLQPNLTSVESWGETQIKVTWQPFVHVDSDKPHFYELYIDDYLEYFGNDLIYVARRLTPDTVYHFKLRSCIQENNVCSLFSKTLSGTTDQSHKHGFTRSFFQWTLLCLVITVFACSAALVGTKITRRLWRSFLYRYDYRSETNLQVPKYVASTDTIDEDLMSSLCLKILPEMTDETVLRNDSEPICRKALQGESKEKQDNEKLGNFLKRNELPLDGEENALYLKGNQFPDSPLSSDCINAQQDANEEIKGCRRPNGICSDVPERFENPQLKNDTAEIEMFEVEKPNLPKSESSTNYSIRGEKLSGNNEKSLLQKDKRENGLDEALERSTQHICNAARNIKQKDHINREISATSFHLRNTEDSEENVSLENSTNVSPINIHNQPLSSCNHGNRDCDLETRKNIRYSSKRSNEKLTLERAHTSPKITRELTKSHRRTSSYDSNFQRKKPTEVLEKLQNVKTVKHSTDKMADKKYHCDVVIVVDNSNIFIGAQECATLLNPHQRKKNIRVKIQQLVKVFQRGRAVSRAFVQGSSPPTTEQVWEVYRRLGYSVDLEDRRGKDEQRVDEGLHLHIYKALVELSPRTLVIASGDGNRGKSGCATSLPGCAAAAIERGWQVEVHSWKHSTSMEWFKLSQKYPEQLSIHYLDRYIKHIIFTDGKCGRKCEPFPVDFFKSLNNNMEWSA